MRENMVVTAGAGTGKTTCLIGEILRLVEAEGIALDRILAITFTDAAAAEIKDRLRDEIEKKALDSDDDVWITALSSLERAQISTIHSLANRILRENPIDAGIDPDFSIEEEVSDIILTYEIWNLWADEMFRGGNDFDDDIVRLIKKLGVEGLKKIGKELARRPDRLYEYSKTAVSRDLLWKMIESEIDGLRRKLGGLFPIPADEDDNLYRQCLIAKEILSAKNLDEFAEALSSNQLKKDKGNKNKWRDIDALEKAREIMIGPGGVVETLRKYSNKSDGRDLKKDLEDDEITMTAIDILTKFVDFERNEKKRRGLLTYFDLLYEAERLLRENLDIRKRYSTEFDYILVDEFQDIDPLQGDIILFLSEKTPTAKISEDVILKPGKLFIVGDPKQSIYRFRDADIGVFFKVKEKIIESGGEEKKLGTNYRSQRHLIRFQNEFFKKYIKYQDEDISIDYSPLDHKIEDITQVEIEIRNSDPDGEFSAEETRTREAEYIAKRIFDLVDMQSDGKIVWDSEAKRPRAPSYKDIAILFRALKDTSHIYEEALKEVGIPYFILGGKGYFQRQEIYDVANILGALYDPTDLRALVAVLRSPIFGIDDKTIYHLRRDGNLDYLDGNPEGYPKKVYDTLRYLNRRTRKLFVSELIDEIFERTEILEVNSFESGGAQRAGNLMKIRRMAHDLESKRTLMLPAFIYLLRELAERDTEEGEAVVTEEVEDSVKIMTVHKAKGLEFPIVFLPDLGRAISSKKRDGIVKANISGLQITGVNIGKITDLGYRLLIEDSEKKKNDAEERRLFYVAATRARDRLILVGSTKNKNSHMKAIVDTFEKSTSLPGGSEEKTLVKRRKKEIGDFIIGGGDTTHIQRIREDVRIRQEEYTRAIEDISFTSVVAEIEKDEAYEFRKTGKDIGTLVGSLVHEAFERIDFKNLEITNEIISSFFDTLSKDPDVKEEVIRESKELVSKFQKSEIYNEIASSEIIGKEIPILTRQDEKTKAGRCDIIYRIGDQITVLDYKTDRVTEEAAESMAETYRYQIDTYVATLRDALGINIEIRGAIHFVRVNKTIYF